MQELGLVLKSKQNYMTYRPGIPEKFENVFSWNTLNRLLGQCRLEPPRLRIVREGVDVPASQFIEYVNVESVPRILPGELHEILSDGATLILNAINELHLPIQEIANYLATLCTAPVQVNLYAGFEKSQGFDPHWDTHDVVILQIAGQKEWKVYGFGKIEHPISNKLNAGECPRDVKEQFVMNAGDMLYLPRGSWHAARTHDSHSLHLTIGIHRYTGIDLLEWIRRQLLQYSSVWRADLPLCGTEPYLQKLQEDMHSALSLETIAGFWKRHRGWTYPQVRTLCLPQVLSQNVIPRDWSGSIAFSVAFGLCEDDIHWGNVIRISWRNKAITLENTCAPVVRILTQHKFGVRLVFLKEQVSSEINNEDLRKLLEDLIYEGLLVYKQ